ncbi:MAG: hypothetical protein GMKNLPBB_00670 [Myxococcota bacterium]|nr:hypothetical protein [Myxococcota bacterium]
MFAGFFLHLREQGLPVSITEYMTLVEALRQGLHGSTLMGFYHLARMTLVKSEAHYDSFDVAFSAYFGGIETSGEQADKVLEWLANPKALPELTPEQLAALKALSTPELRELFEQRLREQKERHDGGNKWIGTGGTSPFGHSGVNPAGIRVGGEGGGQSAVQVATERRFREYRRDVILDTRQISTALRKLRILTRDGLREELDLDETVDKTCRDGGEIDLVFRPERKNRVHLMLLMDVGGSMDPYARLCSQLFSAAHAANHFKDFKYYYFHNCVYETLYEDVSVWKGPPTGEVLSALKPEYRVILLGDAYMHPGELTDRGGSIYYHHNNALPGIEWLKKIRARFERAVWLNPKPPRTWGAPSIELVRDVFPMFPLTVDGLDGAMKALTGSRRTPLASASP